MKTQIKYLKSHLSILIIIILTMMVNFNYSNVLAGRETENKLSESKGNQVNNLVTIEVKAIIGGLYNPLTERMEKSPLVKVFLKKASPPFATAGIARGFIDKNTFTGTFVFGNIESGVYYIVLKSNNSTETWSKENGENITVGETITYDFTSGKNKAFGGNLDFEGKYALIYSGDTDQDGFISRNDLNIIMRDLGKEGESVTDLNGDEFVDAADLNIAMNNYEKNIKRISPDFSDKSILELKIIIDGLCDHPTKSMVESPYVKVYLRNTDPPYDIVSESNGTIFDKTLEGDFFFPDVKTGNYYIVVKYKNTIETWSRLGGEEIINGGISKFDFTTGKDKAYGENMEFEGDIACILTGDVDQDGFVTQNDMQLVINDLGNEGDLVTDINGDKFVDAADLNYVMNNYENNVRAITPMNNNNQLTEKNYTKENFTLNQNSPNPFNPSTKISFNIPDVSKVKMSVYDMTGKEIVVFVNSVLTGGTYSYEWNASNYSSGTYFCRLNVNGVEKISKMMLVK